MDIRNAIAHGTYGTVYRGTYDGQDVAVKALDWGEDGIATAAKTAALRASFRQEVAVWLKLDHPNVTKVKLFLFSSSSLPPHLFVTCMRSLVDPARDLSQFDDVSTVFLLLSRTIYNSCLISSDLYHDMYCCSVIRDKFMIATISYF
ncbi:unnamed protein product [Camellia sinensis]